MVAGHADITPYLQEHLETTQRENDNGPNAEQRTGSLLCTAAAKGDFDRIKE